MQIYFSDANIHDFHLFCVIFPSFFEEYIFRRVLSRWPPTSTFFFIFFKILFFGHFPFCDCARLRPICPTQDEPSCIELKDPDDL